MSKELPFGADGLVEKRLSWEHYLGNESRIAVRAFEIYQKREAKGIDGTPEQDWQKAEKLIKEEFTKELLDRSASSLRRNCASDIIAA